MVYAMRNGATRAAIGELLRMRASANASDKDGETPLLVAVRPSDNATVQLLCWAGVAPNISDLFGETALMEAAGIGNTDLCQILLDMHADIMQANEFKLTALDFAEDADVSD